MRKLLISALATLVAFNTQAQSSSFSDSNPKVLTYEDRTYEPQVQTVMLHPAIGAGDNLLPAVIPFGQWNLLLEFDDLQAQQDNYYVRIVHCNHDWTKSDLMDLDFLGDYNEYTINSFQYSVDTHLPYIHYTFSIPAVKLPGNYVVVVYRNGDKEDFILTKRFMVYKNQVVFSKDGNLISSGKVASAVQQLNFTINYENLNLPNPLDNLWVVIRQNQRWDNIVQDIKPSFVRNYEQELDYIFFDDKKMFKGGNEFRFFDIRSLNYPGRNTASVNKKVKPFEIMIQPDQPRNHTAYAQYNDLDGGYVIANQDYPDINFTNYVYVTFTLLSPPIDGDVYVSGAFNYWILNDDTRMTYDVASQAFHYTALLKQGLYNYQYTVKSPVVPPYAIEGTHFETQNSYEIFVYYKAFQPRAEQLVGYLRLEENPR